MPGHRVRRPTSRETGERRLELCRPTFPPAVRESSGCPHPPNPRHGRLFNSSHSAGCAALSLRVLRFQTHGLLCGMPVQVFCPLLNWVLVIEV